MTKQQFKYILAACGCLYSNGKVWYEENELIQRFENMGAFEKPICKDCDEFFNKDYDEFFNWENEILNG